MKTKKLAACLIAVITLSVFSCHWFSKNNSVSPLTGKWKLAAVEDSSSKKISFITGFNPDTARVEVAFITDSTLIFATAVKPKGDTATYHFTKDKTSIIVSADDDSKYDTFAVNVLTDTLLRVSQDGIYFQLTKQP